VKPSDVKRALCALLPTGRALYLWGPPGVSKSALVRQAAAELGLDLIDWRALLRDPVDARGVPDVRGGLTHWNPPAELPRSGQGVFFMDEVGQAPAPMQQVCGQIALERRCGDYALPDGWHVVAASNRLEDRAGTFRAPANVLRRFTHLDVEVDLADWQAWAAAAGVAVEVRTFLNYRPNLLFQFDPAASPRTYPCPANWEAVSRLLPAVPDGLALDAVAGTVGEGPAAEFIAFREVHQKLPDLDAVLAAPQAAPVPREPAVLYALAGALAERCRGADARGLHAACAYIGRLPEEFAVLAMRDAAAACPAVLAHAGAFLRRHADVLLGK
jgi:hypothetical protein